MVEFMFHVLTIFTAVSVGFFDDIHIPLMYLPEPTAL